MLSASSYVYAMQINLQHVFNMSASGTHACFESHTPLVNGCVDDVLFNAAPNVQQTLSSSSTFRVFVWSTRCCIIAQICNPPG